MIRKEKNIIDILTESSQFSINYSFFLSSTLLTISLDPLSFSLSSATSSAFCVGSAIVSTVFALDSTVCDSFRFRSSLATASDSDPAI